MHFGYSADANHALNWLVPEKSDFEKLLQVFRILKPIEPSQHIAKYATENKSRKGIVRTWKIFSCEVFVTLYQIFIRPLF